MKIALKKGVRGAISQKAALGILIYIHQIHLFIIPVHEDMSKFTEVKVTLEMNSDRGKFFGTSLYVQGSAKRRLPDCVSVSGKLRQKW